MREKDIQRALEKQRAYFRSGRTLPVEGRLRALRKLRAYIMRYEKKLYAALKKDLGKSSSESYMCEIEQINLQFRLLGVTALTSRFPDNRAA